MNICKIILIIISLLFISSCATPVTHQTASGRPEVCISNATPKEVSAELSSELINRSYSISEQSSNIIKADRPIDNFMGKLFLGSRYDSQPNARVIFNIVNSPDCVRAVADLMAVTNPGSAFERLTKLNNAEDSSKVQQVMNEVKSRLEMRASYNSTTQLSISSDSKIKHGKYYSVDDFFKNHE